MPAVETLLDGLDFNDDAAVVLDQALGPLLSTLSSGSDKARQLLSFLAPLGRHVLTMHTVTAIAGHCTLCAKGKREMLPRSSAMPDAYPSRAELSRARPRPPLANVFM